MKKIFTLLSILYFSSGFSQTNSSILPVFPPGPNTPSEEINKKPSLQGNYFIVIQSLPTPDEDATELNFDLEKKGTYTFKLDPSVVVPEDYTLILQDKGTGNTFDPQSKEHHSFSINRSVNKSFLISMKKTEQLTITQKELLGVLLF